MPESKAESLDPKPVLVRVIEPSPKRSAVELIGGAGGSTNGPVLVPLAIAESRRPLLAQQGFKFSPVVAQTFVAHSVLPDSFWQRLSPTRISILSAISLAIATGMAAILGVILLRQEAVSVLPAQYSSSAEYSIPSTSLVSPQIVPSANDGADGSGSDRTRTAGVTVSNVPVDPPAPASVTSDGSRHLLAGPAIDNSLDVTPPSLQLATPEHSADFVPSAVLAADLSQPKFDVTPSKPKLAPEPALEVTPVMPTRRTPQGSDKDAILAALQEYSRAWSDKDIADILALRPHLGRRTVKQELADVRSIAMRIRPIGSPKIEGDQAAVDCIHEVSETFGDGVARQIPGTRMTYFLARGSAGTWQISDSH